MSMDKIVQIALDCGAHKATIVTASQIITSPSFRDMCSSNACGMYGRCWMCPPDVGEIHTLINEVKRYPHGLWYQTVGDIEDSYDFEGMAEVKQRHFRIAQQIEDALCLHLSDDYLHLGAGGCGFCSICAKAEGLPCRFPDRARASLEAYGIDVYNTTKSTELLYINGLNTVTYFGIILFG